MPSHIFSRIREDGDFDYISSPTIVTDLSSGGSYGVIFPIIAPKWYQIIKDDLHPRVGGIRPVGEVDNLKWKVKNFAPFGLWYDNYNHSIYDVARTQEFSYPLVSSSLPSVENSKVLECSLNAFRHFHEQIPLSTSVANFLFEAREYPFKAAKFALMKQKGRALKRGVKSVMQRPIGTLSDQYLAYNFDYAPSVSDIFAIVNMGDKVSKRLDYLRKSRGKLVKLHYRSQLENILSPDYNYVRGGDTDYVIRMHTTALDVKYSASATLFQELEGLDDAWASWKSIFAASGFNNPVSIAWNALPFSFVLDWILPIGNALKSMAIQPFMGRWDVYNVSASIRVLQSQLAYRDFVMSNHANTSHVLALIQTEYYRRWAGLPMSSSDIDLAGLSPDQQTLFDALIYSIFGPKKHK